VSAWGDSELLVETTRPSVQVLLGLGGTAQIVRLPRILSFLQGEPQVAALLEDLQAEATRELQEYDAADARFELKSVGCGSFTGRRSAADWRTSLTAHFTLTGRWTASNGV